MLVELGGGREYMETKNMYITIVRKLAKCTKILNEIELFIVKANSACKFVLDLVYMQLSRDTNLYVKLQ
jgi:hypothetical protein